MNRRLGVPLWTTVHGTEIRHIIRGMTSYLAKGTLLPEDFSLPVDQPFTTRQARRLGVRPELLTRWCAQDLVRRMLKGVYVATSIEDSLTLRATALEFVVPPTAVVTDETAAWLFGADVLPPGSHLEIPPVCMFQLAGNNRLRNQLCASGQRTLLPEDLTAVEGIKVTTPIRTAWDLGRLRNRDRAIVALDGLLRLGMFERDELVEGVERFRRERGVVQLRELVPLADARAQSPAESVMRLRWLDGPSLPPPTPQTPVFDASGNEVFHLDLGIQQIKFGAEYDGEEWHSSDEDKKYDEQRRGWIKRQGWTIRILRKRNVFGADQNAWVLFQEGIAEARRKMSAFRPRR